MNESDADLNVLGEGRPATAGGEAPAFRSTMGGPLGGQLGRPHVYPSLQETALATVPNDYAITLEKESGERLAIETIIGSFEPTREHSAISDWQATVPYDPEELEEWTHETRAWITWDGRVVYTGYCKSVSSTLMSGESDLSGYGPGIDLDEGVYHLDFANIQVWRAFESLFEEIAEDWTYHIVAPPDPMVIDDFEVNGTALKCIEQLADEYNWNFLINQSEWHHIEVFKPGFLVANATWERLDAERELDTDGYYNATGVIAGRDEETGERITAIYEDVEEIERHAAARGVSYDEARKLQAIKEDSIDSQEEAKTIARARTEEAIDEAEVTGSIDTWPTMVDPGKAYPVREWDDDAREGPYSLLFDGDADRVTLPSRLFNGLEESGGVAMFVRAAWSDMDVAPVLGTETHTMTDAETLALTMAGETVAAAPAGLPDDTWTLVHYDWHVADGETRLRAGHDGEIHDEATTATTPTMPDEAWFGHDGSAFYQGFLDFAQLFNAPLTEAQYDDIADGRGVPAEYVHARYRCNEGPRRTEGTLFDARGGFHGDVEGAVYAGSPKILKSVDYSHGHGSASGTLNFRRDRSVPAEINRLKRQMQRRD